MSTFEVWVGIFMIAVVIAFIATWMCVAGKACVSEPVADENHDKTAKRIAGWRDRHMALVAYLGLEEIESQGTTYRKKAK